MSEEGVGIKVTGDLDRWGYYYLIRVNQVLEPARPYGLSASPNFTMNFVIDWEKTYRCKRTS